MYLYSGKLKQIAKQMDEDYVLPTITNLYKGADLLEREVFDFLGIKFLGHPDMRRLYLRQDFKGYPLRKNFHKDYGYSLEDDVESGLTSRYSIDKHGKLVEEKVPLFTDDEFVMARNTPLRMVCSVCRRCLMVR